MTHEDPNRLRWGDIFPVVIPGVVSENPAPVSQQIVNARAHDLPETWTIFLYCAIDHMPPGGVSVSIVYGITIGVGASTVTFPFTFFFGPAIVGNPTFSPYEIDSGTVKFGFTTLFLPARDIQINAQLSRSGQDTNQPCLVGAWVAPRVSFPAQPGAVERPPHTGEGLPRWMPPGFEDGELRYR